MWEGGGGGTCVVKPKHEEEGLYRHCLHYRQKSHLFRLPCCLSIAGIVGSNPAESMGVCLVCLLCVVQLAACATG